ncbi:protein phosphatase EYA [Physcomitrium patens]|uniref:protein phosphatase EYA n=1 Tax=Physcomitrium patens TaxID=3218 RepID=UPI003CCE2949
MIQVEEYNHSNVNSLEKYDDGAELSDYECKGNSFKAPLDDDNLRKLSYLHRYISHLYDQGLESLLSPEQAKEWSDLYEATDAFTDGWLSAGNPCFTDHAIFHQHLGKPTMVLCLQHRESF